MAVAILEIVGIGEVSLNGGEFVEVEFVGDMGLMWGMGGIPGTYKFKINPSHSALFLFTEGEY